jgi:hypothetical protein
VIQREQPSTPPAKCASADAQSWLQTHAHGGVSQREEPALFFVRETAAKMHARSAEDTCKGETSAQQLVACCGMCPGSCLRGRRDSARAAVYTACRERVCRCAIMATGARAHRRDSARVAVPLPRQPSTLPRAAAKANLDPLHTATMQALRLKMTSGIVKQLCADVLAIQVTKLPVHEKHLKAPNSQIMHERNDAIYSIDRQCWLSTA